MINYKFDKKTSQSRFNRRIREGVLILTVAISLFLLVSLLSYKASDPSWSNASNTRHVINFGGNFGAWLADILFAIFGYIAYLFPFIITYSAWVPFKGNKLAVDEKNERLSLLKLLGISLILISGSGLAALYFIGCNLPAGSGGILGDLFCNSMRGVVNPFGAGLIMTALFLAGVTLFSGLSWVRLADNLGHMALNALSSFFDRNKGQLEDKKTSRSVKIEPKLTAEEEASLFRSSRDLIVGSVPVSHKPKKTIASNYNIINGIEPKAQVKMDKDYEVPVELLDLSEVTDVINYTDEQLHGMSQEVELRLHDFGIDVQVTSIHPGPVITRFELQLAAGTKVSKITALAKDLARSLSVTSVRIVEIIQGKSVIGLELPNERREIIKLCEILDSKIFKNAHSPLTIALGKDISGNPVIVDLAKMPHLLIAGTTGSGKSVGLNAILLSLLYKYSPKEVRLLLIDPKMLELSVYDGIPHLLTPVVTNMKEAGNALRWCIIEMERRYRLMSSLGVRNIIGYNTKVRDAQNKGAPLLDSLWHEKSQEEAGASPQELQELPYIVVLADEFADMMMVVGKKVEELITRLAQKARAAGIHLILATQRPSVDVITGLIKANIPSRIAFQVSSKIDSRTILDQMGAEQLLGNGDMLYLPPGTVMPLRVHGAFVSDGEVHKVANYLKQQASPEYIEEILEETAVLGIDHAVDELEDAELDSLYDQAVAFVMEVRRVSTSSIQRRFKIGYNRAARIVDAMEKAGLVSPMESNGNRELLAMPENE
jgi:DNA segregation ATPase FtsK/SpoIIIE, S-DNA-T family